MDSYLLKVYKAGEVDRDAIAFGLLFVEHLGKSGLPVSSSVQTGEGSHLAEEGGNLFALWEFVQGQAHVPGNREQLVEAAGVLARIHRAGADMAVPAAWDPISICDEVVGEIKTTWQDVDHSPGGGPIGLLDGFRSRLARLEDAVSDRSGDLPTSVIHGDYRAQNLLYGDGRVVAVLDLDGARPAPRLFDLAYALAFFQAVMAADPLTADEQRAFLEAYHREVELTGEERHHLPVYLELSVLRGLTLWMRIAYVEKSNDRAAEWVAAYLPMLSWLDRHGEKLGGET